MKYSTICYICLYGFSTKESFLKIVPLWRVEQINFFFVIFFVVKKLSPSKKIEMTKKEDVSSSFVKEEWCIRRSERIFLSDAAPPCNYLPIRRLSEKPNEKSGELRQAEVSVF